MSDPIKTEAEAVLKQMLDIVQELRDRIEVLERENSGMKKLLGIVDAHFTSSGNNPNLSKLSPRTPSRVPPTDEPA